METATNPRPPWGVYWDQKGKHSWIAADIHLPGIQQEFKLWWDRIAATSAGNTAISRLLAYRNYNSDRYPDFKQSVLFACWCASKYKDWGPSPTKAALSSKKYIKYMAKQQEKILEFFRRKWDDYPGLEDVILGAVADDLKEHYEERNVSRDIVVDILYDFTNTFPSVFDYLLDLENERDGRYFRTFSACVRLGKVVTSNRALAREAEWGLAFELALRFYYWAKQDQHHGDPTDILGRPFVTQDELDHELIARLVWISIDSRRREPTKEELSKLRKRIRDYYPRIKSEYPSIEFVGWPIHQ